MDIKKQIRKEMADAVAALPEAARKEAAARLAGMMSGVLFAAGKTIAAFMPMPDEIDVLPMVKQAAAAGWKVVIPKVQGSIMEFYRYSEDAVKSGAWGILEPEATGEPVLPEEIDVMLVPGRAFTEEGGRLGRGKGFYDRYMSRENFHARTIGVCFKCQIAETLPEEPHDRKVDAVIAC